MQLPASIDLRIMDEAIKLDLIIEIDAREGCHPTINLIQNIHKERVSTYIDKTANLEWQIDCPEEMMTWYQALEYARLLGEGWRLPTIKELFSIVNFSKYLPAIDKDKYGDTYCHNYWSGTTYEYNILNAWYVNFKQGIALYDPKENAYYARCVRSIK